MKKSLLYISGIFIACVLILLVYLSVCTDTTVPHDITVMMGDLTATMDLIL